MRKNKMAVVAAALYIAATAMSCSNDSSSGGDYGNLIVGKWRCEKQQEWIGDRWDADDSCDEALWFTADGKILYLNDDGTWGKSDYDLSYSVKGNQLTETINMEADEQSGRSHTYTITELTGSRLVFENPQDYHAEYNRIIE